MANFFQKFFYNDYQCQILDLIAEYDVHHRRDDWAMMDESAAHCCEESYSIRDRKFFIVATRIYNSANRPTDTFSLRIEDNRPESEISSKSSKQNEKFAKNIYYKMKNKYLDTHYVR